MTDLTSMRARTEQLLDVFAAHALRLYDQRGTFHAPAHGLYGEPDSRDRMRVANILLHHGGAQEQKVAEALIMSVFTRQGEDLTTLSPEENFDANADPGSMTRDWNIFESNDASRMLPRFGARLSDPARAKLERITRRNFSRFAGSAQADYLPRGYNDNMPAQAMAGLILGGEALANDAAVADGRLRLEWFAEQLSRRGAIAENSSPNYTGITLAALADVAEHSADPEIKTLALDVEHRLWANISLQYHIATAKSAGASRRSYTWNSVGHIDTLTIIFWLASGLPRHFNPLDHVLDMKSGQVTHFDGDPWKSFCDIASAIAPFHFPDDLQRELEDRIYPHHVAFTSESEGAEGGEVVLTCWQQPEYSLATSTAPFNNGAQTESFYITYKTRKENPDFGDSGTIYARYLYNDDVPGKPTAIAGGEACLLRNQGIIRAVQKAGAALVLSRACNHALAHAPGDEPCETAHRLRLAIIVPCHFSQPQEVWLGARQATNLPAETDRLAPVFLDLGRAYVAFNPLILTDLGRSAAVRIERVNRYMMISLINYEGEAKPFTHGDMREVFNGFSIDISGPDRARDFTGFRESWEPGRIEDLWFTGCRRTRLKRPDTDLMINWITAANRLKNVMIDGREISRQPIQCERFCIDKLPFVDAPYHPMNDHVPDDSLNIAWNPQSKWQRRRPTE